MGIVASPSPKRPDFIRPLPTALRRAFPPMIFTVPSAHPALYMHIRRDRLGRATSAVAVHILSKFSISTLISTKTLPKPFPNRSAPISSSYAPHMRSACSLVFCVRARACGCASAWCAVSVSACVSKTKKRKTNNKHQTTNTPLQYRTMPQMHIMTCAKCFANLLKSTV